MQLGRYRSHLLKWSFARFRHSAVTISEFPDATRSGNPAALHFQAEYAERTDQHEVDLRPGLSSVLGNTQRVQDGPVVGQLIAQAHKELAFGGAARALCDVRRDHPGHQAPTSKNASSGAPGAPAISARSSRTFISSQLTSGSNTQAWQAARLRESTPAASASMQSGSDEHHAARSTASRSDASRLELRPC